MDADINFAYSGIFFFCLYNNIRHQDDTVETRRTDTTRRTDAPGLDWDFQLYSMGDLCGTPSDKLEVRSHTIRDQIHIKSVANS